MVSLAGAPPSRALRQSRNELLRPDTLDDDALRDLLEKVEDALETITMQVMILERSPADRRALDHLIRAVRTLKSHCRISYLVALVEFLQTLDGFLTWLSAGRTRFTFALGEALLLSLDQVKLRIEELRRRDVVDIGNLCAIVSLFEQMTVHPADELPQYLAAVIKVAGGDTAATIPLPVSKEAPRPLAPAARTERIDIEESSSDLGFFRSLGAQIDARCPYWHQRTETQLQLALGINQALKKPVDVRQLTAAVYLHDLGMVFLSPNLINKPDRFDAAEEQQLRDHVQWSYQWLRRLPGWDEAAIMVLQHHERPDGNGYPAGITAASIHDGAQIIAIADTFFSITHERADRVCKKSLLRAVAEINAYRDAQFTGTIVDAFNTLMRQLYASAPADPLL